MIFNKKQQKQINQSNDKKYHFKKKQNKKKLIKKINKHSSSSSSSSSSCKFQLNSNSSTSTATRNKHYHFKNGQKIGSLYKIKRLLGDGTFGRVVQAQYKNKKYAIKIIRPVQRYIQSAKSEKSIIKRINNRDPNDTEGIVRYLHSFYHHQHFCMVFRPLGKSLYQVLKINDYRGLPITIIQPIFKQILQSIGFLHRIGYTHTDLKPENILLQKEELRSIFLDGRLAYIPAHNKIRIIDFGGATRYDEHHSSIICTRQYRPPQVILECCKWNEIADVWSIGCIISQIFTGELLFPTHGSEEHLAMIERHSGIFPHWMVVKTPSALRRLFHNDQIVPEELDRHIETWRNLENFKSISEIFQQYPQLADLLNNCLQIDPNKRINCQNALKHPFFTKQYQ